MEKILYSLSDYKLISTIAGFIIIGLETFLPVLPVLAIVMANSFVLGMWPGFFVSWVGSSIASILLYYLANKFSKASIFKKYKSKPATQRVTNWISRQGFNTIFISYACPFIPDFLVTITSGFTSVDIKTFVSGMICGKFIMFLIVSYIGEDVTNFFSNPSKIIVFSVTIMIAWFVGQNINNKIHKKNNKNKE